MSRFAPTTVLALVAAISITTLVFSTDNARSSGIDRLISVRSKKRMQQTMRHLKEPTSNTI